MYSFATFNIFKPLTIRFTFFQSFNILLRKVRIITNDVFIRDEEVFFVTAARCI